MRRVIGRLANNALDHSSVAMFFYARQAIAVGAPDRNHELQKMLQLFTEFFLICINFKFVEHRKVGFLILII